MSGNVAQKEDKAKMDNYPLTWYYELFCKKCDRSQAHACYPEIARDCISSCIAISLCDMVRMLIQTNEKLLRIAEALEKLAYSR